MVVHVCVGKPDQNCLETTITYMTKCSNMHTNRCAYNFIITKENKPCTQKHKYHTHTHTLYALTKRTNSGKNEVGTNVLGFSPKNSTTVEYASCIQAHSNTLHASNTCTSHTFIIRSTYISPGTSLADGLL